MFYMLIHVYKVNYKNLCRHLIEKISWNVDCLMNAWTSWNVLKNDQMCQKC